MEYLRGQDLDHADCSLHWAFPGPYGISPVHLTVALPDAHRQALSDRLDPRLRAQVDWRQGEADVVLGLPWDGRLAQCAVWPGLEGAQALVEAGWRRLQDQETMERLHAVGRALVSEHDQDRLLDLILTEARSLLSAEAGSLYLVMPEGDLLFAHTQNAKVALPYRKFRFPISAAFIAGFTALTGQSLNLPDVYRIPDDAPYRFNDSFDRAANYHTTSMLVVPLKDSEGHVLGVLQLINRLEDDGQVVPFLPGHQSLAESLGAQAGVAVRNAKLRTEIEELFKGFVKASVKAIEQRDPVTRGHSRRVARYTVGLARVINATPNGPYGGIHFTDKQIEEIRYASLLHDFGKVGVREQVLVKSKKLDPLRLELILQRLRQRQEELLRERLLRSWRDGVPFDAAAWRAFQEAQEEEVAHLIALVRSSNEPTVLPEDTAETLGTLLDLRFTRWDGQQEPLVEPDDLACLRIRKGSLSDEERRQIESHVQHTYRFLKLIPWTADLARVPDIAHAHHERLNGRGYPLGIGEPDIPLQSRAMSVSDIFDALQAQDRPYKKAVPLERSLAILHDEVKDGHLDPEMLRLFVEAQVWTLPKEPDEDDETA